MQFFLLIKVKAKLKNCCNRLCSYLLLQKEEDKRFQKYLIIVQACICSKESKKEINSLCTPYLIIKKLFKIYIY